MYADRLEVRSPGTLVSGLNLEQLLNGESGIPRTRNPVIAEVLKGLAQYVTIAGERLLVERQGFGLITIRADMQKLGAHTPEFEATPTHFRVVLWAAPDPRQAQNRIGG